MNVTITITGGPQSNGRVSFHWKLTYGGETYDDGGANASEADDAATQAIEKYRSLVHNGRTARRAGNAERSKNEAA